MISIWTHRPFDRAHKYLSNDAPCCPHVDTFYDRNINAALKVPNIPLFSIACPLAPKIQLKQHNPLDSQLNSLQYTSTPVSGPDKLFPHGSSMYHFWYIFTTQGTTWVDSLVATIANRFPASDYIRKVPHAWLNRSIPSAHFYKAFYFRHLAYFFYCLNAT